MDSVVPELPQRLTKILQADRNWQVTSSSVPVYAGIILYMQGQANQETDRACPWGPERHRESRTPRKNLFCTISKKKFRIFKIANCMEKIAQCFQHLFF